MRIGLGLGIGFVRRGGQASPPTGLATISFAGAPRVGSTPILTLDPSVTNYSVFLETILPDRYALGADEYYPILSDKGGHEAPLGSDSLGMMVRFAVAVFNGSGGFTGFTYSNVVGPVDYASGYLSDVSVTVTNAADLGAAIANNAYTKIAISGVIDMTTTNTTILKNKNREAAPLTICSADAKNMAVIQGGVVDMASSRSITLYGLKYENTYIVGSTTIAQDAFFLGGTRNCTLDAIRVLGGARIADADYYYPGNLTQTNYQLTHRNFPSLGYNQINLTIRNCWSEMVRSIEMAFGENLQVYGNRWRGWWYDGIRWADDETNYSTRSVYLDRNMTFEPFGLKDEAGTVHPDQMQFLKNRACQVYIDRHFALAGTTRAQNNGALQGFFNSGSGVYRGRVRGSLFIHSAPNAFNLGVHRDICVVNTLTANEDTFTLDPVSGNHTGNWTINWTTSTTANSDYPYTYRVISGCSRAQVWTVLGTYVPGTHKPLTYLNGGLYDYNAAAAVLPFMADSGHTFLPNPRFALVHYRAKPGYETYGPLTTKGYCKPMADICPAPVITAANRSGSTLNCTITASAGAVSYLARWRNVGGWWNPNREATFTGTTFAFTGIPDDTIEMEVIPFGSDGSAGAHTAVYTVAGLNVAPTLSISTPTDGAAVGVDAPITLTVGGYPVPTVTPSAILFNGSSVSLSGTSPNYFYNSASAGTLTGTFTAANGVGSNAVSSFSMRYFSAAPSSSPTFTAAATAYRGEIQLVVTGAMASDATSLIATVGGVETTLPFAAGTYYLQIADGVSPGVAQTVYLKFRNVIGDGTAATQSVTSLAAGRTKLFASNFVGLAAATNLQTQAADTAGNLWSKLGLSTQNIFAHNTTLGLRIGGSSGTQNSHYLAGNITLGTKTYIKSKIYVASNAASLQTMIHLGMSSDGLESLSLQINNTAITFGRRTTPGTGTVTTLSGASYSWAPTTATSYTIEFELEATTQRLYIDGSLVATWSVPILSQPAGLSNGVGVGMRISSGANMTAPNGKLVQDFEAGTF